MICLHLSSRPSPPSHAYVTRHAEIDFLRTLAIASMAIFHLAYDLHVFYGSPLNPFADMRFIILGAFSRYTFLLLVGISFFLSHQRFLLTHPIPFSVAHKYAMRGLRIAGCAALITLITYFFDPSTTIRFGILHLIATSIVLLPLFARLREQAIVAGLLCVGLGTLFSRITLSSSLFLAFGLHALPFHDADYFPIFPWFGIVLIGFGLGSLFYRSHIGSPAFIRQYHRIIFCATLPGRHSLLLYLIHQPLLLALLILLYGTPHR